MEKENEIEYWFEECSFSKSLYIKSDTKKMCVRKRNMRYVVQTFNEEGVLENTYRTFEKDHVLRKIKKEKLYCQEAESLLAQIFG